MEKFVTLRPIRPDDHLFLLQVYSSTRADELAILNWDDAHKNAFLKMQFEAQHNYYQENYKDADFQIVLLEDKPIGRLYVARWEDEIRLIDIALLPEYRRRGIGTDLLNQLLAEAQTAGKPVRIHVERFNPALGLYQRLGFNPVADKGVYLFLEWQPCS